MGIFDSLAAFRAHCGEPTLPLEDCPICSALPPTMYRENVDGMVVDDRPDQALRLVEAIPSHTYRHDFAESGRVERCPRCVRLYFVHTIHIPPHDYQATWRRLDAASVFDLAWAVDQRIAERVVRVQAGLFPHHVIVWHDAWTASALDHDNHLTPLDRRSLAALIERDPPRLGGDLERSRAFALLVDAIEHPKDQVRKDFAAIRWREPVTTEEQHRIDRARARSAVAPATAEPIGDDVRVRFWVTTEHHLVCRTITVSPDGRHTREEQQHGTYLPLPIGTPAPLTSRAAFRAYCGTRVGVDCALCRELPDHSCDDGDPPAVLARLDQLPELDLRRCPTCLAIYRYWTTSFGNDIYTGNQTVWDLQRFEVDALFDSRWALEQRLPHRRIDELHATRLPHHGFVRSGAAWLAIDDVNRSFELEDASAIARLIERDPPPLPDLEAALRHALLVDDLLHAGTHRPTMFSHLVPTLASAEDRQLLEDVRSATGLPATADDDLDLRPTARSESDGVMVRTWVVQDRRLICRVLLVRPDGQVSSEDVVIAEGLPIV